MVRGRKKYNSNAKTNTASSTAAIGGTTPVKTNSKRKFKGKLSHSNTVLSNKITQYYNVSISSPKSQENSPVLPPKLNDEPNIKNESPVLSERRSILQETNNILESNHVNVRVNSDSGINKTESCVPFSPSTALSQLDLDTNKKVSKINKLPVDKIPKNGFLKSLNESADKNSEKNNSRSNVKIVNNVSNLNKNQTKLTEFYPVRRSARRNEKSVLEEKRKTLEKAILSNNEEGLEIRMFEGKGRGVVAARKFLRGEFVVEYAGELITMDEAKKREAIYAQDENTGCYMYYFKHKNNQYCVDATAESNRFGRLLNHSRNGNLSTKTVEIEGIPHLILIAKEDIEPGLELTYDYGDRSKLSLQFHPWLAQ